MSEPDLEELYEDPDVEPREPDAEMLGPAPRTRHRSSGLLYLCRVCGREVGFALVADDGTQFEEPWPLRPCTVDGPLQRPADPELAKAVAKTRATGRPVRVRLSPIR